MHRNKKKVRIANRKDLKYRLTTFDSLLKSKQTLT